MLRLTIEHRRRRRILRRSQVSWSSWMKKRKYRKYPVTTMFNAFVIKKWARYVN